MRLFGRNRRKTRNKDLRELISSHEKEASKVQELARELIATINGDEDWLRKRIHLEEKTESGKNGRDSGCLPGNTR